MFEQIFVSGKFRTCLAIALATIAFTQWGYLWYATIFDDVWQRLIGRTEQELVSMAVDRGSIQFFFTYFISLVQVIGVFLILKFARAKTFFHHQIIAVILSVMVAAPVLGNAVLFEGASAALWRLDIAHFILGYAGIALVIYMICNIGRKDSREK